MARLIGEDSGWAEPFEIVQSAGGDHAAQGDPDGRV